MCDSKAALIVDADPQVSAMLAEALHSPEWRIEHASGDEVALKLAGNTKFDVILMSDKTSSHENIERLQKIRHVDPHSRVIILSNEKTPLDVIEAMKQGAFSYFSEPFSMASLANMVTRAAEDTSPDDGIEIKSATPTWVRLRATCDLAKAERLLQFIHEMIDLPQSEKEVFTIALRELLLNAIEHGGHFDPQHYVEVSYLRTRRAVACRVKDPGEGFSFDQIPHAAVTNPPDEPLRHQAYREAEKIRPGGFGILLARNSIDELVYSEKGNEVLLIKYLDSGSPAPAEASNPPV